MIRYFFLLIVLSVTAFSCKKKPTVWESFWSAPLINDTLSLENYVNDSTLTVSSSGFYNIDLHRTLLDVNLGSLITIPDTTFTVNYSIQFQNWNLPPGSTMNNDVIENNLNLPGIELKKIRIGKGFLDFKLLNPIGTKVEFTLSLPGVTKDGIVFEKVYSCPAGTNVNPGMVEGSIALDGYYMDLTGKTGGTFNVLQSALKYTTDINGPSVNITNQDITKIVATIRDIEVDYARGYMGNQIISDTTTTTVDFLSKITAGTLDLPSTNLQITITNGLKIPARATIHLLENKKPNESAVPLTVTGQNTFQFHEAFNLDPATGSWNTLVEGKKTISFNSINSTLENYLENRGALQTVGYAIELNPWGNTSGGWNEIFPNSRIKLSMDAQLPLSLGADNLTYVDTFDLDMKQDNEKSHIVSGEFVVYASNAFPIEGKLILHLLDQEGKEITAISSINPLNSSLSGPSTSGTQLQTKESILHFPLSAELISKVESIKKVAVEAIFNTPSPDGTGNQKVLIPDGAFIAIKAKGAFQLENRYK